MVSVLRHITHADSGYIRPENSSKP